MAAVPMPIPTQRMLGDNEPTLIMRRPPSRTVRIAPLTEESAAAHLEQHDDHHHHVYGHVYDAHWVSHGLDYIKNEVLLYLRTLWSFTFRPKAAGVQWVHGDLRLLHPLNFLIKSLTIASFARGLWWVRFGLPQRTVGQSVMSTVGPYIFPAALAVLVHFAFRRSGSKHPLSASVAALLYAFGAGPTFFDLLGEPLLHATMPAWTAVKALKGAWLSAGPRLLGLAAIHGATSVGESFGHVLWLAAALAGIHGTSRRRAALFTFLGIIAFFFLALALLILGVLGYLFVKKQLLH